MDLKSVAIIGGGNIGSSIAKGFLTTNIFKPENITITTKKPELLEEMVNKGIIVLDDKQNLSAIRDKEIVIVCVLPHQIKDVMREIKDHLDGEKQILISIVTGVSLTDISAIIGLKVPQFRAMPNTAIKILESMTCLSTINGTPEQKEKVAYIFNKLGRAIYIEESNMAAATVIGSCGTAFSLRYIRATSQGGIEIGFDAETALLIAAQTIKGAAMMLLETGNHPEQEIDRVTTPLGCTIAGLNEMEHQGFSSALIKGLKTSFKRIDKILD